MEKDINIAIDLNWTLEESLPITPNMDDPWGGGCCTPPPPPCGCGGGYNPHPATRSSEPPAN